MTEYTAERPVAIYNINGYEVGNATLYGGRVTQSVSIEDNLNLTAELLVKNPNGDLVPYCLVRQDSFGNNFYYANSVYATSEVYKYNADGDIVGYDKLEDNIYKDAQEYTSFYKDGKEYQFLTSTKFSEGILIESTGGLKLGSTTVDKFEQDLAGMSEGSTQHNHEVHSLERLEGMQDDDLLAIIVGSNGVLYDTDTRQFLRVDNETSSYKVVTLDDAKAFLGVSELYVIDKHAILTKYVDSLRNANYNAMMYNATTFKALPVAGNTMFCNPLLITAFLIMAFVPLYVRYSLNKLMVKTPPPDDNRTDDETDNGDDKGGDDK